MSSTYHLQTISDQTARDLLDAASTKAQELNRAMAIAVCDHAGELKAFIRMDGAPPSAASIAQNKAYTAASFGLSTDKWHSVIKDDPALAMGFAHTPRLIIFGGGYPVIEDGQIIGALGVSGGHYSDDMECAKSALTRFAFPVS